MATRKPRRPRAQKAVVDRFEDGKWAVLLVGRDELEKIVPVEQLPEGVRAGSWLKLRLEEDRVHDIEVDEAETRAAQRRVRSKLDLLRQRGAHFTPQAASDMPDESKPLRSSASQPADQARPEPEPDDETPEARKGAMKLLRGPVEDGEEDGEESHPSAATDETPPDTRDE